MQVVLFWIPNYKCLGTVLGNFIQQKLQELNVARNDLMNLTLDQGKAKDKTKETYWSWTIVCSVNVTNIAGSQLFHDLFYTTSSSLGIIEQLIHLNVSGCSMEKLHVGSRSGETIQTHLKSVDLSHNHLTSLPAYFMNIISNDLVYLYISG